MTILFLSRKDRASLNTHFLLIQQEKNVHGNLDLFLSDILDSFSIEEEQIGICLDRMKRGEEQIV